MDAKAIQQVLDGIAAQEKSLTRHQIANSINAANRVGDPAFSARCSQSKKEFYSRDNYEHLELLSKLKMRGVITPWGNFNSVNEFHKFIHAKLDTKLHFNDAHKAMPHLYYYTDTGPLEATTEKVLYTPWGNGARHLMIKKLHKIATDAGCEFALANTATTAPTDWFKKMSNRFPEEYYTKIEPRKEWRL